MRTSRASKDTAKVLQALSPPARRQTRSSHALSLLRDFAYNGGGPAAASISDDDTSSLSSVPTVDIEDLLEPPAKRRKSALSAPRKTSTRSSRRVAERPASIKKELEEKPVRARRVPARKIKRESGDYTVEPPSNWETMYAMVKKMREENPTAPVDTMGCAELYWRASSPRDRRFQTLIALMLSSQTKDTVTAVAMQRLHTELGDQAVIIVKKEPDEYKWKPTEQVKDSTLNLENILAVAPERLNELIRTVGFHNNKTKYIKAAALIIRDQYDSDIPSTAPELMKLPGVGPKMAFLCMSAAWGKHDGIGVDVHVHRITNLWGWHKTKNPEETRMALESWLPKDKWHEINKLLVGLGQTVCLPVARRCGECDLAGTKLCKSEIKGLVSRKRNTRLISFVDLPENIKKKIFEYVGLLRPCLINISFEQVRSKLDRGLCSRPNEQRAPRGGWTASWTSFYEGPCDHPKLPIEVFQSCQAFREDAGALFFAHNRFSMLLYSKSDFVTFRTSMEWGMHHMRYLHLDLGPRDNRFLKIAPGVHRTILKMWVDFCDMSRTQMPSLRYFSMKCKVRDLEVACKLMCMMDPFPALFHCAFHLGHTQDDDIRPVIKRAAWRLTDNLPNKPPFQFSRLPKEIQLMVLEEILLNRSDPTLQPSDCAPGIITFQDRKRSRIAMFHSLTCCGTCSPLKAMCFCYARQTAFSTSCTCFSSPLPYFLVSREFYENARRIFFTKNKFAFVEEDPEYMMRFLHYIPTASTLLIQHLSFKFPVCYRSAPRTGPRSEDATMLSWSVLRRFIREHFDLSRLSVKIVDLGLKGAVVYSQENRKRYLRKLLFAFSDLAGLREFRVYLADDHIFEREAETAVLGPIRVERKRPGVPFISRQYLESVSV
ncbi:hypothetical protein BO94DRAFT_513269 [Aspergillus sclerotioniger CBS 115572]|uniref:Endonuclease III homolog n=1 Tax=Aspergillus sclerotioniger CBS 115572 TaxID=1450535 RepID=A0A317WY17_9EURO|nr:hypothetical protein BO94DRAFT_513269 [Aspergillus sclerotioniger CBS 115572]PWY91326.1 hypothetical protein BO94DRAFT_513269 [Aspergillus sclerotioniger CBS 115572]